MDEDIVVPFRFPRDRAPPVSRVRSTLITSSLQSLRRRGREEEYAAYLPAHCRDPIFGCIAGTWLPIGLAVAHYETCDRLDLTPSERLEMGAEVAQQVQGSVLLTLARSGSMANAVMGSTANAVMGSLAGAGSFSTSAPGSGSFAGPTPWMAMSQFQRLWDRLLDGGALAITRVGPKEARLEILGLPLARIPYFRVALRGFLTATCEVFGRKVYTSDVPKLSSDRTLGYRIAWA